MAYEAFLESVKTYPFRQELVLDAIRTSSLSAALNSCQMLKQISATIDRVTYMGICDLFCDPSEVSAKTWLGACLRRGVCQQEDDEDLPCIIGAILERQADAFASSRWKREVRNATYTLLVDALDFYTPQKRPIRRSRVLLKLLELKYFSPVVDSTDQLSIQEIGQELQDLLTLDVSVSSLSVFFEFVHLLRRSGLQV